ncbi:hypothetical protein CHS0354_005020 [Potamilus streckersoni]|uniref:Uncharacterized protein n=1 Tax=Potamilus streckersoni TaxID=2493646 RepID=A0AAE0SSC8_9BIVA|nr:hypothetical protein CHS0354_005020 [Potamilus streckersoni]
MRHSYGRSGMRFCPIVLAQSKGAHCEHLKDSPSDIEVQWTIANPGDDYVQYTLVTSDRFMALNVLNVKMNIIIETTPKMQNSKIRRTTNAIVRPQLVDLLPALKMMAPKIFALVLAPLGLVSVTWDVASATDKAAMRDSVASSSNFRGKISDKIVPY